MSNQNKLFTFKSGRQVILKPISPFLLMELRKQFKKPVPPMQEVDYGDGIKRQEPNVAHPDHIRALEEHESKMQDAARRLIIQRGVYITLTDEERQQVVELKEYMREEHNTDLRGRDEDVYITYILLESGDETTELVNEITGMGQPSPGGVDAAVESFQGDLPA